MVLFCQVWKPQPSPTPPPTAGPVASGIQATREALPTCHGAVALESQHVVLAGTGAHQVEAALAAGSREVADILGGWPDRSPAVRIGVIAFYFYCVQGGACGRIS